MNDKVLNPCAQKCLQKLMQVWFDFERQLERVPVVERIQRGTFTKDDYLNLLLNLRQQVIEGSRWIARTASSFDRDHSDVRSIVLKHAKDEHKDYEILEKDFCAVGGEREKIESQNKNIGSEALHSFMMFKAGSPNPVGMLGAMWIIEGLGQKMASEWALQIDEMLGLNGMGTDFMKYHGANDEAHMDTFYLMLDRLCQGDKNLSEIVKVSRVTAKLYALQLEEVDNEG
ncbi:MAG: hypothetical protein K6L73_00690 [Cellvibrionaceae bacterium]